MDSLADAHAGRRRVRVATVLLLAALTAQVGGAAEFDGSEADHWPVFPFAMTLAFVALLLGGYGLGYVHAGHRLRMDAFQAEGVPALRTPRAGIADEVHRIDAAATKLAALALMTSMEASRAGARGQRCAAMAEEIGSLAYEIRGSALQIRRLSTGSKAAPMPRRSRLC